MGAGCSSGSSTASTTYDNKRSKSATSSHTNEAGQEQTLGETLPPTSVHEPSVLENNSDSQTASTANGQVVIEAPPQDLDSQSPVANTSDVRALSVTPHQSKLEINNDVKIETISHFPDVIQRMLCGRPCPECYLDDKAIKIFHIVSFRDYRDTLNTLWEQVYPSLSQECLEKGCELQVIDFTWGMPDPWADDYAVRKMQENYIIQIMQNSSSTIFTVFLDEICSENIYPHSIMKEDFDNLMEKLENESEKELLQKWYRLQEFDVMTSYCLQPITDHIKTYGSGKMDQYQEGVQLWEQTEVDLVKVFSQADEDFAEKYLKSDMEQALERTVLSGDVPKENIIWVRKRRENNTESTEEVREIQEKNEKRFKTLCNKLKEVVDPTCYIEIGDSSKDTQQMAEDVGARHLMIYREVSEKIMTDLSKYDATRVELSGKGLPRCLYDELLHQSVTSNKLLEDVMESLAIPEEVLSYITIGKVSDDVGELVYVGDEEKLLNGEEIEDYQFDREMMTSRSDSRMSNKLDKLDTKSVGSFEKNDENRNKLSPDKNDLEESLVDPELQKEQDNILEENNKNLQKDMELCDDDEADETIGNEESDVVRPLVLTAGVGCGKSTTCALITTEILDMENWANAVCIYRHISTDGRQSVLEVVASVMQQICVLCDLHISLSYKSLVSHPEVFKDILKEVPVEMRIVIILDGWDRLAAAEDTELEWLPRQLPFHIRLILTMTRSCDMFNSLRKLYPKDCFHFALPTLPVEIAQEIFTRECEIQPTKVPQEIHDKALELVRTSGNPLHARLIAVCCSLWAYDDVTNALCSNVSDQIAALVESIQLKMGLNCCGHLLTCINESRFGITDVEVMDILTGDLQFLMALYCYIKPESQYSVPLHVWIQAKSVLAALLSEAVINGCRVSRWQHGVIGDVVTDMYDLGIFTSVRGLMLDYFTDKWSSGPPGCDTNKRILTKRHPRQYGDKLNTRRLTESTWLMLVEHSIEDLDICLFDVRFLCDKLKECGLYPVLDDVKRMLAMVPSDEDVAMLLQVLHHCSSTLGDDAVHLPNLIHLLDKEGEIQIGSNTPKMHNILKKLSEDSPVPYMIPSAASIIQTFTLLSDTHKSKDTPKWQHLFRIPDHPHHMLSLGTNTGDLIVWDITNLSVVRKVTSLRVPRDVRLITSTRAVILCDRELRVINLDEGKLEAKLKGVLNLKMPYFSIHNNDHVIALSRNRMYVNLINTTSGDMVTTFKAGEDRFLNSLHVSADGMTCVCGDEVQKPFPLLVWDLRNRKLVHDLRIHGHEFLTKMAAITDEGHYIVCVSKELDDDLPSFLIVYDLQSGTLFKKWRPKHNVTSVAISSKANIVVSAQEDGTISVWDMVGGTLRQELKGPVRGANRLSLDNTGNTCVSWDDTCQDTTLWMWDIGHGICLGAFPSEVGFSCCELSMDGSTVVVGVKGCEDVITLRPQNHVTSERLSKGQTRLYGDSSRLGAEVCITDT